jgi:hypothetical protein
MNRVLITTGAALAACITVAAATQAVRTPQEQTAPAADIAPASDGLSDLNAVTFGCPKAALNAAARQAAKAPSQGTYQFSYFKIVNDTHHAAYEVHFTSNYEGETELKYCVEMYCQQGFDPKTTKAAITVMSSQRAGVTTHGEVCGGHTPAPVTRGSRK